MVGQTKNQQSGIQNFLATQYDWGSWAKSLGKVILFLTFWWDWVDQPCCSL
jgi:hypothetical protein